jgi:PAS domain S-box-containing protein
MDFINIVQNAEIYSPQIKECIIVIDASGRITDHNKVTGLFPGIADTHLITDFHFVSKKGDEIPQNELPWFSAMQSNSEVYNTVLGVCSEGSDPVWNIVSAKPLLNSVVISFTPLQPDQLDLLNNVESKYRTIFQTLTEEVHIWRVIRDNAGAIKTWELVDVNPSALRTWGRNSLEEIIGKTTDEIFGPHSTEHYMPVVQKVMNEGTPYTYEDYFPNLDKHFKFTTVAFGEYFITTGSEITNLKKLQESSESQIAQLTALFNSVHDNILVYDMSGKLLMANKSFLNKNGFKNLEEFAGSIEEISNMFEVSSAEGKLIPSGEWPVQKVLRGETISDLEYKTKRTDTGQEWYLSFNGAPICNKEGKQVLVMTSTRDITEKKLAELALKNSEDRFHTLADNISQLVWMTDGSGKNIWVNKRFTEYTGMTSEELSKEGLKIHHPDYVQNAVTNFKKAIEKRSTFEDIFPLLGKDGNYRWFLTTAIPIFNSDGQLIQWFGTNTDITEHKILELKLEEALSEIKERLDEKETLLRELYHRTKNNMQVISSLLSLRGSRISDEGYREIFEELKNRIQAMALVHEKLYQSRNLSKLNLGTYIKDLVELLLISHLESRKKIEVVYNLCDMEIMIDEAIPCGFIITELVLNILKHAFPGDMKGIMTIMLKKQNNLIELTISDNGIGINDAELDNEEKLGLQIFKSLAVDQLNAEIDLNREKGVSWSVRFPEKNYSRM